jgi:ribosomal protein S18 acetylase RimI-like enzyme
MIREIADESGLRRSVAVLRESFAPVADEFGLTEKNCQTNPAFITRARLEALRKKGVEFFGLYEDGVQIGFVALEKAEGGVYYLEKLAVAPAHRHKGHGKRLVEFACEYAFSAGATTLSIGIIDGHTVLKAWYKTLGFTETGTKDFPHLPFIVRFMGKSLEEAGAP